MSILRVAGSGDLDASTMRFGVVTSNTNAAITGVLESGAIEELRRQGVAADGICVHRVPGAFELPMAAARLLEGTGSWNGIVCVGALIRGETPHFEVLAHAVATGIQRVACASGVPVVFGVLTCDTLRQAEARSGGERGNKGAEAALAAVEMACLYAGLSEG